MIADDLPTKETMERLSNEVKDTMKSEFKKSRRVWRWVFAAIAIDVLIFIVRLYLFVFHGWA